MFLANLIEESQSFEASFSSGDQQLDAGMTGDYINVGNNYKDLTNKPKINGVTIEDDIGGVVQGMIDEHDNNSASHKDVRKMIDDKTKAITNAEILEILRW
ncbi:MAG: hypothetical protein Q4B09_05450 [Lachnospiraceae bacterium]|nr:hypothetical protein [Lachnospiraceae bacterium]